MIQIGNEEYSIDHHGVVHQLNPQPYTYDAKYSSTYDTEAYRRQSDILQALRLGFVIGAYGRVPGDLCDVGYGNGAFMKFAKQRIQNVYGHDITGVEVPEGCELVTEVTDRYDVVTFWDVLEHYPDISFVKHMRCEMIAISLPHYPGPEKFEHWPHRKPNEHLHHFTPESLFGFMDEMGWYPVGLSSHEDIVRRRDVEWNILSASFKRK